MTESTEEPNGESEAELINLSLRRLKSGDPEAARELWDRYHRRLVALARKKLGDASRRSRDEDDVALDAFASFCRRAQDGSFPELDDAEGLWSLLATITARKASDQRSHEFRVKRGGKPSEQREATTGSAEWELDQVACEQPSPPDAAVYVAELERFMTALEQPVDRLILLWKLEERTNVEIARHLDCSLSAIERRLRFIRKRLSQEIPPEEADE